LRLESGGRLRGLRLPSLRALGASCPANLDISNSEAHTLRAYPPLDQVVCAPNPQGLHLLARAENVQVQGVRIREDLRHEILDVYPTLIRLPHAVFGVAQPGFGESQQERGERALTHPRSIARSHQG